MFFFSGNNSSSVDVKYLFTNSPSVNVPPSCAINFATWKLDPTTAKFSLNFVLNIFFRTEIALCRILAFRFWPDLGMTNIFFVPRFVMTLNVIFHEKEEQTHSPIWTQKSTCESSVRWRHATQDRLSFHLLILTVIQLNTGEKRLTCEKNLRS
jgi:hypothetical protein